MQSISSREFNQNVGKAKRAAEHGPVFITTRGTPAHVLLTVDEYNRLTGRTESLADMLTMPKELAEKFAAIAFNPSRSKDIEFRDVNLS